MGEIDVEPPSVQATDVLKGVAILLIMAHNFYHHIPPVMGENEFSFQDDLFLQYSASAVTHPERALRYFFSYFGHIDVQLFVFLTAYGYGMQSAKGRVISIQYLLRRFTRVYIAFSIAFVLYLLLISAARIAGTGAQPVNALDLFYRVTLISNLVPHQALKVVGPWWYVSFLLQVMLVLPLIISIYTRNGRMVAVLGVPLFVAVEWVFNSYLMQTGLNINQTVFGFIPLLIFGVAFAFGDFRKVPIPACLALVLVLAASNFYYSAWLVYDIAFVVIVLVCWQYCSARYDIPNNIVLRGLGYLGSISLYLFLVNGFLRFPFLRLSAAWNSSLLDFVLMVSFVLVSIVVGVVVKRGDALARRWLRWPALHGTSK